jgi:hypothetical protein
VLRALLCTNCNLIVQEIFFGIPTEWIQRVHSSRFLNSPALPRAQPPVEKEKPDSVLTTSQLSRLARKGARVEFDSVPPLVASIATLSPDVPTSSVQPVQPAELPGVEVPWLSKLLCLRILCRLVCPLNV